MDLLQKKNKPTRVRILNIAFAGVALCVLARVLVQFHVFRSAVATDNAQVRRQLLPVNSRVQGYVRVIAFHEYGAVHKGDLLVQIDDSEAIELCAVWLKESKSRVLQHTVEILKRYMAAREA